MFGIGTGELLLILFLVFLIYGPKRLPELAQKLGKAIRDVRNAADDVQEAVKNADPTRDLNEKIMAPPKANKPSQSKRDTDSDE